MIKERNFIIYRRILYMIDNRRVIEEDSTGITIEIGLFEHRKLLEDLTNNFFTKKTSTRKVEKKIGHVYFVGNPFLTIKFTMVSGKICKLKHLALRSIYCRLLNTSCIFTYNRWRNCRCDQSQGCQLKPIDGGLLGDKNYCFVCHVGVTYDAEKIENLIKIADVTYNFCAIKKDIQILDVSL